MSDLLKSLIQESQKRAILCYWGKTLQIVLESLPNLRWGEYTQAYESCQ